MARRKRHEEHTNHEAWAIPYGDLITLLLAFFVVLYATSSLNEGKYRVLSYSMAAAFSGSPRAMSPVQLGAPMEGEGGPSASVSALPQDTVQLRMQRGSLIPVPFPHPGARAPAAQARQIEGALRTALSALEARGDIRIRHGDGTVEIIMNSDLLFASGSADLAPDAEAILRTLAGVLATHGYPLVVEGHTDNVPIRTPQFPSNWELSASRAGQVIRMFTDAGVAPSRLSMRAFGEHKPDASNATAEGRARNRRVMVIITLPESDAGPSPA